MLIKLYILVMPPWEYGNGTNKNDL
jgi:hypothetical protein